MAAGAAIAGLASSIYQIDQGKKQQKAVKKQQQVEADIAEAERLQDAKTANQESASITLGSQDATSGAVTSLAKPQVRKQKQQQIQSQSGVGLRV